MARLRRLTRRQKILLAALRAGGRIWQTPLDTDLQALEAHGHIACTADGIVVNEPQPPELASTDELAKLQKKYNKRQEELT